MSKTLFFTQISKIWINQFLLFHTYYHCLLCLPVSINIQVHCPNPNLAIGLWRQIPPMPKEHKDKVKVSSVSLVKLSEIRGRISKSFEPFLIIKPSYFAGQNQAGPSSCLSDLHLQSPSDFLSCFPPWTPEHHQAQGHCSAMQQYCSNNIAILS